MSYVDQNLVMSDAQAVTATASSTNSIDTQTALRNLGSGEEIDLVVTTTTTATAAGAATVTFSLDDSSDNSSFTQQFLSAAIAKASLVAGFEPFRMVLPRTLQRYIQVTYTVATGPLTAGNFSAYLTDDRQDNVARPAGFTLF